jgi:hypothetical protein
MNLYGTLEETEIHGIFAVLCNRTNKKVNLSPKDDMYRRMEVQLHASLMSARNGVEWSQSLPSHFTATRRAQCMLGGPQSS